MNNFERRRYISFFSYSYFIKYFSHTKICSKKTYKRNYRFPFLRKWSSKCSVYRSWDNSPEFENHKSTFTTAFPSERYPENIETNDTLSGRLKPQNQY